MTQNSLGTIYAKFFIMTNFIKNILLLEKVLTILVVRSLISVFGITIFEINFQINCRQKAPGESLLVSMSKIKGYMRKGLTIIALTLGTFEFEDAETRNSYISRRQEIKQIIKNIKLI